MDGEYYLFKTDILNGQCTYSTDKNLAANLETISAERAKEIIELNRRGEKPLSLLEDGKAKPAKKPVDLLAGADLSRFDKAKKRKRTTSHAITTDNKVVDHNATTVVISVMDRTTTAAK